jgi:hypothetical protein
VLFGLLSTSFAACSSSDMNGGNVNTGSGGHAGGAAGHGGGPAGGAGGSVDCADKFISLGETLAMWNATWVIDDAAKNAACPNAIALVFGHYNATPSQAEPPLPKDPEAGDACPPPADFYRIQPNNVKECDNSAFCPTSTGGYGFWVHAIEKRFLGGTGDSELASEQLWLNSDGEWTQSSIQGEHVTLYTSMKVRYFSNWFLATQTSAGTCRTE